MFNGISNVLSGIGKSVTGALLGGGGAYAPSDSNGPTPYFDYAQPGNYSTAPSSGGAPAPNPNTGGNTGIAAPPVDPYAAQYAQANNTISQLNGIYNSIFPKIQADVGRQVDSLNANYDNQTTGLNNQFESNARTLPWAFASRGTAGSTDYGNSVNDATNTYNNSLGAINNARQGQIGQLGQYAGSLTGQYQGLQQAAQDYARQISANHSMAPYLQSTLDNALVNAQQTAGGLGSYQDFMNQIQGVAPQINGGATQLQGQLSGLANANVPSFAANAVQNGFTGSAQQLNPANSQWLTPYQTTG